MNDRWICFLLFQYAAGQFKKALFCGRQFPLVALKNETDYRITAGLWGRLSQPNRPLSRGTRVVPIRATPPPAISCFIPK